MNARSVLIGLAAAATLALASAPPVAAVCTYNTLTSDVPAVCSVNPTYYQFTQATGYWSAVAVRPRSSDDWDIFVYSSTAADPTCVSGMLAGSAVGGSAIDFVIGDFNHDALGTYYISTDHYAGTNPADVEWDDGPDLLVADGAAVRVTLAPTELIRVYDVYLAAGTTYSFDFYPADGSQAHLLLFRNAAGGVYWTGRSARELEATGPATYLAPTTGFYGVVVTNDASLPCAYVLGVSSNGCGIPITLAPNTPVTVPPTSARFAADVEINYWTGVAVRPVSGDWDVSLFSQPTGSAPPQCLSTLLTSSVFSGSVVDIDIGDYNRDPLGWSFEYADQFSGAGSANVEYLQTQGVVFVNDNLLNPSIAVTELGHLYDVYLLAGHTYDVTFLPSAAGLTLLLWANTGGGTYWAGRGNAVVSTTTTTTYTAPVTGYYGIGIMNDGSIAGSYFLGIGDCSLVTALSPGTPVWTDYVGEDYFSINQQLDYWTAVAVRSTSVDWDLFASSDNMSWPWPACASLPLATSTGMPPIQDFIVGDFNLNPTGIYYFRAHQFTSGAISPGQVEWDSGADLLVPNDNNVPLITTGASDVIHCWDVGLNAGQSYQFTLSHTGGASLKMLLFRNAGGGTYWAGRSAAVFETATSQTYTAPATGFYGVVVVNDDGLSDTYGVHIATCDPVIALAPPPTINFTNDPLTVFTFTQGSPYWTPVGARAYADGEDWDITADSSPSGGALGVCTSGQLAASIYFAGTTDFVIGDFNFDPLGTYAAAVRRYSGVWGAYVQDSPSPQLLMPNAGTQFRNKGTEFVVESWDTQLLSGGTYTVYFTHVPGLNAKVDVFAPTGGVLWEGRASAMIEGSGTVHFVAPVSGWYGIVVVNDGGSGAFVVGVYTGNVAVDGPAPPERDALQAIAPNPGRAGMRFDYALHESGEATFEILDMAGRRVASFPAGAKGAGEWSVAWAAQDDAGRPLHPGLYFVRMRIGDRTIGSRKLTLLE